MKLELKHLAPYLPYGLKIAVLNSGICTLEALKDNPFMFSCSERIGFYYFEDWDAKPLLLPLAELKRDAPKTVSGIRNIDLINNKASYNIRHRNNETYFFDLPEHMSIEDVWETYEQLFENLYDVFGLIDAGLAINKLTL